MASQHDQIVEHVQNLIASYDLNHNNGGVELCLNGDNNWDVCVIIEAPNHTTIAVEITDYAPVAPDLVTHAHDQEVYGAIWNAIEQFDAEREFEEVWSPEFGKHNGFGAFQFVDMLIKDEEHFKTVAQQIWDDHLSYEATLGRQLATETN